MKTAFYTWITDSHKNTRIDFHSFYKSFKYFHPDIDLIVFEQSTIDKLFNEKPWLNSTNCKASFAKLIYNDYDLLVGVDSDFYFFDRCEEILQANYDIGAAANFNSTINVKLNKQTLKQYEIPEVSYAQYIQGGLIASTNKTFWDEYENMCHDISNDLPIYENDVLNAIWYSNKYKTKVLDGSLDYTSSEFKCYYNCSSLGRIGNTYIENDRVYLDGRPMRSYHVAWGWNRRKERVHELFPKSVSDWFYSKINK